MFRAFLNKYKFDSVGAFRDNNFDKKTCCYDADCGFFIGGEDVYQQIGYLITFLPSFVRRIYGSSAMRWLFGRQRLLKVVSDGLYMSLYVKELPYPIVFECPVTTRVDTAIRLAQMSEVWLANFIKIPHTAHTYEEIWSQYVRVYSPSLSNSLHVFCSRRDVHSDHDDVERDVLIGTERLNRLWYYIWRCSSIFGLENSCFIRRRVWSPCNEWIDVSYLCDYTFWALHLLGAFMYCGMHSGDFCKSVNKFSKNASFDFRRARVLDVILEGDDEAGFVCYCERGVHDCTSGMLVSGRSYVCPRAILRMVEFVVAFTRKLESMSGDGDHGVGGSGECVLPLEDSSVGAKDF